VSLYYFFSGNAIFTTWAQHPLTWGWGPVCGAHHHVRGCCAHVVYILCNNNFSFFSIGDELSLPSVSFESVLSAKSNQTLILLREGPIDEYQILYIWTPWFTLVRPLALLFSDVFVSFCVLVFYRSIRKERQKFHVEILGNSEVLKSRSIEFCPKSINRIKVDRSKFSRTYFCRSAPEHPIKSFSMTKSSSPSDFRSRTRWFRDLGCL
jgi:hypothetical protein